MYLMQSNPEDYLLPDYDTLAESFLDDDDMESDNIFLDTNKIEDDIHAWEVACATKFYILP